jgi:molybdenum cofactor guanylyltransferase
VGSPSHRAADRFGAIVLVGGRSSRMGMPKASLEWHGSTLLRRVVGIVERATQGPVIVVRASAQGLPALPDRVRIVDDARAGRGPLEGIAAGLAELQDCSAVYVSSTDCPFLHPAFVTSLLRALADGHDAVLPHVHGHPQPLSAVYRPSLLPAVEELATAEGASPRLLLERVRTLVLEEQALLVDAALAAADPGLRSLVNLNDLDAYRAARAEAPPAVTVRRLGDLHAGQVVAAATLAEAAAAAGVEVAATAAVNGLRIPADPSYPLVQGDLVEVV